MGNWYRKREAIILPLLVLGWVILMLIFHPSYHRH